MSCGSLDRFGEEPKDLPQKRWNKFSKLRSQPTRDYAAPLARRHFRGPSGSIPELCHEMDSLRPAVSKLQGKTERADSLPMPWSLFSSCSLFCPTVSIVFLRGARTSHEHPTLWAPLWIHLRCGYCTARYTRRSSFLRVRLTLFSSRFPPPRAGHLFSSSFTSSSVLSSAVDLSEHLFVARSSRDV